MIRLPTRFRLCFLSVALLSFVVSVSLWFLASHVNGAFAGLLVPSILALGVGLGSVSIAAVTLGGSDL